MNFIDAQFGKLGMLVTIVNLHCSQNLKWKKPFVSSSFDLWKIIEIRWGFLSRLLPHHHLQQIEEGKGFYQDGSSWSISMFDLVKFSVRFHLGFHWFHLGSIKFSGRWVTSSFHWLHQERKGNRGVANLSSIVFYVLFSKKNLYKQKES